MRDDTSRTTEFMKKFILVLVITIFIFSSCIHFDKVTYGDELYIKNLSNETVHMFLTCDSLLQISDSVQIFDKSYKEDIFYNRSRLDTNMIKSFYNKKISDNNPDKQLICPNKKLNLFVILDTTISNYSWDKIVEKQMYKEKIVFTQEDLDSIGYTFIYTK